MSGPRGLARRLLEMYVLPSRDGRLIVAAVIADATGSGLYLAGDGLLPAGHSPQ